MRLRVSVKVVGLAAGLTMGLAAVVATGSASASGLGATPNAKTSMAGPPQTDSILLCGSTMPATTTSSSGSVDHFSYGATGTEYTFTTPSPGVDCQNVTQGSSDTFMWMIGHGNVQTSQSNPQFERGTEHGTFTLSSQAMNSPINGANGHVTNYDWNDNPDPCSLGGQPVQVEYQSGRQLDPTVSGAGCTFNQPGRYNTRGGAQLGEHLWGNYGTIIYQNPNMVMKCPGDSNGASSADCFQAILEGKAN